MEAAAQSLSKETARSIERVSIMNATGHFRLQIWTRTSLHSFLRPVNKSSGNMPPIPSLSKPLLKTRTRSISTRTEFVLLNIS